MTVDKPLSPPVVLIIAGLDPSGGAGLTADIQTLSQLGCHPAPVASCLTAQNTQRVWSVQPVSADYVREQIEAVVDDVAIAAIKLGLLPNVEIIQTVQDFCQHSAVPVICDPVLIAGSGDALTTAPTRDALLALLPFCSLITPNLDELTALADEQDCDAAATKLLAANAQAILATGGDSNSPTIRNHFYTAEQTRRYQFERQPQTYHGSGCTLSAAITGYCALGHTLIQAVDQGQRYTARAIEQGYAIGQGQLIPYRINAA